MAKRQRQWVWVKVLSKEEKAAIGAVCERFITETLKPRFLPEVRPTDFNYPVDIFGKWRASKYSFITRYRSDRPDRLKPQFDVSFARLDHVEENAADVLFDVMWRRHTGQWWCLYQAVSLEEGLRHIETDPILHAVL